MFANWENTLADRNDTIAALEGQLEKLWNFDDPKIQEICNTIKEQLCVLFFRQNVLQELYQDALKGKKAAEEKADKDPLTNLFNRRSLEKILEQEITKIQRTKSAVSVLMLDIDHFKKINDQHGHQVGDEVLKTFADILKSNCRETDFCCRYGGEEFTIILPSADSEEAQIVAERIRNAIEKNTINYNNQDIKITTSIGVATKKAEDILTTAPSEREDLIRTADLNLYEAKTAGRNRVSINHSNPKNSSVQEAA